MDGALQNGDSGAPWYAHMTVCLQTVRFIRPHCIDCLCANTAELWKASNARTVSPCLRRPCSLNGRRFEAARR